MSVKPSTSGGALKIAFRVTVLALLAATFSILQWNCRSLYSKTDNFKKLIQDQNSPDIICIQESMFPNQSQKTINIEGYNKEILERKKGTRGLITFVKNNHLARTHKTTDNKHMSCLTTEIYLHKKTKIYVSNIYRSPSSKGLEAVYNIDKLFRETLENSILCGDFNSHHYAWGSNKTSTEGRRIKAILEGEDYTLFNTGDITRVSTVLGQEDTCIDLTIGFKLKDIKQNSWVVIQDLYNSDHHPILTTFGNENHNINKTTSNTSHDLVFKLNKANWNKYKTISSTTDWTKTRNKDINIYCQNVINEIIEISKKSAGTQHISE